MEFILETSKIIKLIFWAERALQNNLKFENKQFKNTWLIQCVVESNQPFLAPSLAQITQFTLLLNNLKQGYKVGFFFNLWLGSI